PYGEPWPAELRNLYDFVPQGESAELIADRWSLDRRALDAFAVRSQERAAEAIAAGRFDRETNDWELDGQIRASDQPVRPETTADSLAGLRPVFREDGRITAGTSSPICDGAAGVVVASKAAVEAHGLRPRARIIDQTTV